MSMVPGVLGFLVGFPLFWAGVSWLLAVLGGWSSLAGRYGVDELPGSARLTRWTSGGVGPVSYRNILTVGTAPEGLCLAVP